MPNLRSSAITVCLVLGLGACAGTATLRTPDEPGSLRHFGATARTLGGPSLVVSDACTPDYEDPSYLIVSHRRSIFDDKNHTGAHNTGRNPRSVCVTIENLGSTRLVMSFLDDLRSGTSGFGTWVVHHIDEVYPDQTKTICDRTSSIRVTCHWTCEEPECHKFRWRVDMHVP